MNVLITNDDGIKAKGLRTLVNTLKDIVNITVVAPIEEKSGCSQSITSNNHLTVSEVYENNEFLGYGVNGTPADCVKIGLQFVVKDTIDLVISGINKGPNNALNVMYSGTVGGASEGAIRGVLSLAVSLTDYHSDKYEIAAEFMKGFVKNVHKLPKSCNLYNINIPGVGKDAIRGVRFTKLSEKDYLSNYKVSLDSDNNKLYKLHDFKEPNHQDKFTDDGAISENYVSITPLLIDRTDYSVIDNIDKQDKNNREIIGIGDIW